MGQIDRPLGMTLATGSFSPFMAGKTALHARPVGLGRNLVVHDIVVAEGALAIGLLHMEFVGDDDLHYVMFEGF